MILSVFKDVIGHERILQVLSQAADHPAPAYLFVGPRGMGKAFIAERFAKHLLHLSPDASLDAHPDFMRLLREEDKKDLSVELVRDLIERLSLTSAHGGYRVALIDEAERLNEQASNALLKSVEEPAAKTIYFFITDQSDRLPVTLRSRLTTVRFEAIPIQQQPTWMRERSAVSPEETRERQHTLQHLLESPLGVQCAQIEQLHKKIESAADTDAAWRIELERFMSQMESSLAQNPTQALRVGLGLLHARRLVGTALSPRIALEWAAVKPYIDEDLYLPSFLSTPYLQ